MAPCFGPLTGVTATVQPDSSHLIIFARTRRRGLRDVAVTGAITVFHSCVARSSPPGRQENPCGELGQDTRGSGALGTAAFKFFFFFSGLRRRPQASTTECNARRGVFRLRKKLPQNHV